MQTGPMVDLTETATLVGEGEQNMDVGRAKTLGILVFLCVLIAGAALMVALYLLAAAGLLPLDEEELLRLWVRSGPRPIGVW